MKRPHLIRYEDETEVASDMPPIIMYSDKCRFDGCRVDHRPCPGAIRLNRALMQRRVRWKDKETGARFRV